jgi:hypothetical protein
VEVEVDEAFVCRHLHRMPAEPVRFIREDRSYVELMARLARDDS